MKQVSAMVVVLIAMLLCADPASAAHCYCKWVAHDCFHGDSDVQKDEKDGFIQGAQAESCRNYCRGLWDVAGHPAQIAKQLPSACGNVTLSLFAAIGTASYQVVRGPQAFNVGGVCDHTCTCPAGQWLHTDGKSCVKGVACNVVGMPDQTLAGGYFFWKGQLYQITGPATCANSCKH
jgi:hypothetical protein